MGPAKWTWDSVVQSVLSRGMVATITPQLKTMEWDSVGEYDDVVTGLAVEVKMAVAVKASEDMEKFLPYINKIVDGAKILYDGVVDIGRSLRAYGKSFLLHPKDLADDDYSNDFYMPKAVCVSPFALVYKNNEEQVLEATFKGYVDNSTNLRKFQIGDRSAAADTTPPTVSSTVPTAAATGVAKASGLNIDFVMSEDIDPTTVVKGNTLIFKTSDESLFSTYTVSYISASKTIRLTTSGALAGNTEYCVALTTGIKDLNGNPTAAVNTLKFTTGA